MKSFIYLSRLATLGLLMISVGCTVGVGNIMSKDISLEMPFEPVNVLVMPTAGDLTSITPLTRRDFLSEVQSSTVIGSLDGERFRQDAAGQERYFSISSRGCTELCFVSDETPHYAKATSYGTDDYNDELINAANKFDLHTSIVSRVTSLLNDRENLITSDPTQPYDYIVFLSEIELKSDDNAWNSAAAIVTLSAVPMLVETIGSLDIEVFKPVSTIDEAATLSPTPDYSNHVYITTYALTHAGGLVYHTEGDATVLDDMVDDYATAVYNELLDNFVFAL